jgi:DHA1 family bicyclomycin/chloramphenicol resistance-like MFS transporter
MTGITRVLFLIYATTLSVIGLFASDMYLPALANIQGYFSAEASMVGLSISIYMAGFTIAQLFYGSLSDQVGRKKPLIVGIVLFLVGTIGCVYSHSIESFLVFRLIQSIGICAAYILWQPMILDLFKGEEVQKLFSMIMAMGGLSPALAPLVGGYLTEISGWQTVFWVLIAIAVLLLFWTIVVFDESLKPAARKPFSFAAVIGSYGHFFKSSFFLGHACAISSGITLYLVFLTMIPFALSGLGYSPNIIGLMYLPIAITFIAGTEVAKRLYTKLGDVGTMNLGITFAVIGSIALLLVTLFVNLSSAWQIIAPFSLVTFGNGFLVPTGSAYLMQCFHSRAGGCASVMGFITTAIAFVSTALASLLYDALGILAISYTIAGFAAIMVIVYWIGRNASKKHSIVTSQIELLTTNS